jgi:hypothetical protein
MNVDLTWKDLRNISRALKNRHEELTTFAREAENRGQYAVANEFREMAEDCAEALAKIEVKIPKDTDVPFITYFGGPKDEND